MTFSADDVARRCAESMWAADNASRHLNMEIRSIASGQAVISMTVQDFMVNGQGACHGGYIATLADSAFAFACNTYDDRTVAAGFDITFLSPTHAGDELVATAVERVRRGRSGLYDVSVSRLVGGSDEVIAEMRGRSRSLGTPILGRTHTWHTHT